MAVKITKSRLTHFYASHCGWRKCYYMGRGKWLKPLFKVWPAAVLVAIMAKRRRSSSVISDCSPGLPADLDEQRQFRSAAEED